MQGIVVKAEFFRTQTVLTDLARDQVTSRDGDLFIIGVAGKPDDLHAVQQRIGNRFGGVGSGDEEDLREVEGNFKIVIAELGVLFRVKDFQQG